MSSILIATLLAGCAHEAADGRPYIWKIRIKGTKKLKAGDIVKKLAIQETSWIPFTPKHYLDPYALDIDRKRVEAFYADHGYFQATVVDAKAIPRDKKNKSVNVEFTVKEGPPTHITELDVKGEETVLPPLKIKKLESTLKKGNVFVHADYLKYRDRLEQQMKQRGYAWATIDGEVDVDRDRSEARITYELTPNQKAKFGSVLVKGTLKTNPELIKRRAEIRAGKVFDPVELEDARTAIYGYGVFSSVRVEYEHDAKDPATANVIITVQEGQFHELRLGGGVGIEGLSSNVQRFDAHLLATYTKYNFIGGFRTLRLSLKPAYVLFYSGGNLRQGPALTAEAEFTQPGFIFPRLQLRWLVGYDVGIELAYRYTGPRTTLGLSRTFWHNRVSTAISYNFQYWKFFDTDPIILMDPAQAGRLFGYQDPYRLGWWQQDVSLDLRDKPQNPHYGGYFGVSLEEGGVYAGGAFQYEKIVPDVRGYAPLGKRVTLAGRIQYGKMYTQGDTGTPISRRFYLGGPTSHRGFTYNRLAPEVLDPSTNTLLPVGGDEMLLMQGEVRINLFKLFDNWFGMVAFFDAGDVSTPTCPNGNCGALLTGWSSRIDFSNLHLASGAGLRYHTVIGTIRADLGVRINRLSDREGPYDSTGVGMGVKNPDPGQRFAFHLSIGEAF